MKKILLFLFILSVATVAVLANGGGEKKGSSGKGATIVLAHGKVEIDAPFKEFAKAFEEDTGIKVIIKTCGGDSCSLGTQLKADFNAGEAPDIFSIAGGDDYKIWADYVEDQSGEEWTKHTDLGYKVDGKIVGFPVAIEGWGMGYNKDLLAKAGIDPKTLTNYNAYKAAFEKIDGMKAELGIDSVVSMTAGPGMYWVTAHHNINSYLSNGLARDDLSVVNLATEGKLDTKRYREYAMWVKLLFDYSDQQVLLAGDYDRQVGAFANQKAVFIHQGNWIEPNLASAGASFVRAYAPHGSSMSNTDGVFVNPPSWYVINKEGNTEAAKAFLNYMATNAKGHDFMVNKALMIPAFKNVTLKPDAPLSASLVEWSAQGKTYAWNQYHLPGEFRDQIMGPLYEQLAKKEITLDEFITLSEEAYAKIPSMMK